ncbi:MAG: flagellar biosynthesis protein FlhB [Desulfovibrio sp.]|jgi:flagellar biosynthetic protein FlhB|nr:flagellar biosynthesis protein FlhB [Desulfovibrio sp.]
MFGKQTDPSRTENATPKRRDKHRKEGNVPKSQELGKTISLAGGLIALYVWLGQMSEEIKAIFKLFLAHAWEFELNARNVYALAVELSVNLARILLPILLFLAFLAWLSQRIQVGKLWTTNIFKFKWGRFNLLRGLKQMFLSPQTVLRALKSLFLALILSLIPGYIIYREYHNFLPMYYASAEGVGMYMLETGLRLAMFALLPVAAITIFDVWQSRYAYNESIKMTKDEIKDERKQAEGDPVIKSKQRQKMMQTIAKRMLQDIPKADVVITNPTHIAVALRYNSDEAPAPVVLAKGADHLAEKIKALAREHGIPIRENAPLARALYKAADIGEMIPEELYKAVAAVLASIWKLKPNMRQM